MMIQQNTPEWLEMRKNMIGASDAPVIMGDSPWRTPYQLWQEKLDLLEQKPQNEAMRRGHELEPIARQMYNDQTGNCAEPEVVFHPDYEWMMASLDGLSLCGNIVLEIKCPGREDHETAKDGRIPEKYFAQLQHQLAASGLNLLHYFSYRDGDCALVEVESDDKYIARMIKKEKQFWEKLQSFEPPALNERDYVQRDDAAWIEAANEWALVSKQMAELKEQEKNCRQRLIFLAGDRNCAGGGVKAQKIVARGAVDYSAIPEINGVDLEKYRKAPTERWRFDGI